jgi:hypothetical protein
MVDKTYQTSNYEEQGGATWVIGGELDVDGGKITAAGTQASAVTGPAATGSTNSSPYGYTTSAQADAIVTALNDIIAALQGVGILP